jgi:hypothetical protein
MTTQTHTTTDLAAKWAETADRLTKAEIAMQEYIDATDPLYYLEAQFLARHGLDKNSAHNVEKRKALLAANPAYAVPGYMNEHRDKLCSDYVDLASELMAMPAPDLVALRWKLEHTEDGGYTREYCSQMWDDCDRLMLSASGKEAA